jgi:signal transduction histidine kinase
MTPAAEGRVKLQVEMARDLPPCETDASRVEQILVNLVGNAIQHSPEGGEVKLSVTAEGGMVDFTVENDGPGIEASEIERIFDIYVTRKEGDERGVGLGLPLSRRLARLLGGEVRAVALPEGGRFVLSLPASAEL